MKRPKIVVIHSSQAFTLGGFLRKNGYRDTLDLPFWSLCMQGQSEMKANWPSTLASLVTAQFGSLEGPFVFVLQVPAKEAQRLFEFLMNVDTSTESKLVVISDIAYQYRGRSEDQPGDLACKALSAKISGSAGKTSKAIHLVETFSKDFNNEHLYAFVRLAVDSTSKFSASKVIA